MTVALEISRIPWEKEVRLSDTGCFARGVKRRRATTSQEDGKAPAALGPLMLQLLRGSATGELEIR